MNTVEVSSEKPRDFRRLVRATALLLTGAAVHLWLFPFPTTPGQQRFLERLSAGVTRVAEQGAVATSGVESGVIASALGGVAPKGATLTATSRSANTVRVVIQAVHPVTVSPLIPARPRLSNALFSIVSAPETPVQDMAAMEETEERVELSPSLPALADAVPVHQMPAVARAMQPPPPAFAMAEPIATVPPPSRDIPKRAERPSDERLVSSVLQQYRQAYESLDVTAAQTVWPTVDARALGAAFRQLAGQRVTFDSCGVSVSGSGSQATARCTGQAEYVPKVGGRRAYTANGEWVFDLQKENAAWRIINANASIK